MCIYIYIMYIYIYIYTHICCVYKGSLAGLRGLQGYGLAVISHYSKQIPFSSNVACLFCV